MYWLERRVGRGLFGYVWANPNKYSPLTAYKSQDDNYRTLVEQLLGPTHKLNYQQGIWCNAQLHPTPEVPNSGFKIHISTKLVNAQLTLSRIVPVLLAHHVAFKFIVDSNCLRFINSQQCSKGSSGKFVTIYPKDNEQFKTLIDALHSVTADLEGPYILSDKRIEGSKVVFYRYGGFVQKFEMNIYGEQEPLMQLPNGHWVKDSRNPIFELPEGVTDPLHTVVEYPEEVIIKDRYQVSGWLADSNKGGVYAATDLLTGQHVVLKEARPYINESEHQQAHAISLLTNEFKGLTKLAATGLVPTPVEFFQEWEHSFIAMEKLPGKPLSLMRAEERFALALQQSPSATTIQQFYRRILGLAAQLMQMLEIVHQHDVLLIDLSPQNILFDEASNRLWFIDLEAARIGSNSTIAGIGTVGYGDLDSIRNGQVSELTDYQALGGVLLNLMFPVNEQFMLDPSLRERAFYHFMQAKGGHQAIADYVFGLSQDSQRNWQLWHAANAIIDSITEPTSIPLVEHCQLSQLHQGVLDGITQHFGIHNGHLQYRPDYRMYSSSHLSLFHGISGTLHALLQSQGDIAPELRAHFLEQWQLHQHQLSPGIANGLAGNAWLLSELGEFELAYLALQQALESPLLRQNADMYYGATGVGMTALKIAKHHQQDHFLPLAEQAWLLVEPQLQFDADGYPFITQERGEVFHSLGHGAAGVAWFALELAVLTQRQDLRQLAEKLIGFELKHAQVDADTVSWNRNTNLQVRSPYIRVGSAGLIRVLLRFYQHTDNAQYLQIAKQAAAFVCDKIGVSAGYLNGCAGIADVLAELSYVSGDAYYWQQAMQMMAHVRMFAIAKNHGLQFAGEDNLRFADDFGSGSAGVLWVLNRLVKGHVEVRYVW